MGSGRRLSVIGHDASAEEVETGGHVIRQGERTASNSSFPWWLAELKTMWLPLRKVAQGGAWRMPPHVSAPEWILRLRKGSRFQELGRLDLQRRGKRWAVVRRGADQEEQAS